MIVVRDLLSTQEIKRIQIKQLVQQRINDLGGEALDINELGYFLVVEAGDTIEDIQTQVGFNILHNRFTGVRFNATGFTPSFEFIEEFPSCYDMVFVLSDDGMGVEVFVSRVEGVNPDLIAMCQMFSFKGDTS
ncbi:MAG: hypothetical protein ACKVOY_17295 [Burkholderiaceae bacterium]